MNVSSLHVIVVGGATGGCATALLLARAGARVTLVERVDEPRAVGAGIALAENGLAVLESLGLGPALDAARPLAGVRITDAAGRTLLAPPRPAPRVAMIRRATLQRVLLDAVAGDRRIATRFGTEVVAAHPDGTARLRGATTGHEETLQADLVVGADGVHSRVRQCGAFGARVRRTGIDYVRGLVPHDLATGTEAWTPAGIFGSFPVDGGTYFFCSCGTAACRAAIASRSLERLRDAWARAYAPAAPLLAAVEDWDALLVNEVVRVDCERWVDGRLVLVGDAAHAMAPNLGQGANSALVDAAVLLAELRRGATMADALDAWQRRRMPAVRRVADTAQRLGRIAEVTSAPARWVRDRVLLPVAGLLATPAATAAVLQEPAEVLLAIGRA